MELLTNIIGMVVTGAFVAFAVYTVACLSAVAFIFYMKWDAFND